mmetsp:Transcript_20751/g.30469  ORF Transcript_20751/g.30469 Transcript_20751/m.30469 type:complete len:86 (-) Transcript_20751:57-314(-)
MLLARMKRAGMLPSKGVTFAADASSSSSSAPSPTSSGKSKASELNCTQELWLANELQKGAELVESGEVTLHTSALQHKKGGGWSI